MPPDAGAVLSALRAAGERLAEVDPRLALGALLLHVTNHLLRSAAWRGVLAAAYPDRRVPLMRVATAYASGVALNAVAPARGGDAAKVGLARAAIRARASRRSPRRCRCSWRSTCLPRR